MWFSFECRNGRLRIYIRSGEEAMTDQSRSIPAGLRTSFVLHFWADIIFAIPLFVAPVMVLELVGWQHVDPYLSLIHI